MTLRQEWVRLGRLGRVGGMVTGCTRGLGAWPCPLPIPAGGQGVHSSFWGGGTAGCLLGEQSPCREVEGRPLSKKGQQRGQALAVK